MLLVSAPISARITTARGPRVSLMLGAVIVAAGYGIGVVMLNAISELVLIGAVIGVGIGVAFGAIPALIMAAVPPEQTAAANSFNALMRALGTAGASAVAGLILSQLTTTTGPVVLPSSEAFRAIMALGAVGSLLAPGSCRVPAP
ncbi:hypothetical protein [Gordonia sp. KTR9]|uniref:hypothetical protein n=1 Tax=Gordonia sp. KTR9 TaxID=337191 RepID=UPI0006780FD9|nr:hypothetical protein [Gordonia sp. KTR9]